MPDEHSTSEEAQFQEWMVDYALNDHLRSKGGLEWFFSLEPEKTSSGHRIVAGLCGFRLETGQDTWDHNSGLTKKHDLGRIDLEKFKNEYWTIRPDFRFWTKDRKTQLIVEVKGVACRRGNSDDHAFAQARLYFRYLADLGAKGAVLYLVPEKCVDGWFTKLQRAADGSDLPFGVMSWCPTFMSRIGPDLVRIISSGPLAAARALLQKAAQYASETPGSGSHTPA